MNTTPRNATDETDLAEFIRDRGPHCLIVARHGETEWNAEGGLQGQQDIPLNRRGAGQAQAVARFLRSIPLSQVHSSTLRRCQETAGPIADANIGRPNVVSSDLLKETALGVLSRAS
jgi:broad specificity phosphatase PhoE